MREKIKVVFNRVFPFAKNVFALIIMICSAVLFGLLCFLLRGGSLVFPDGDVLNGTNNFNIQVYQESVVE